MMRPLGKTTTERADFVPLALSILNMIDIFPDEVRHRVSLDGMKPYDIGPDRDLVG